MMFKIIKKTYLLLIILFIFTFLYSKICEPDMLVVSSKTLSIPNWSQSLEGLKVGIVSDLHIGAKKINLSKLEYIVNKINSESPDIIFLLGDFDAQLIAGSGISKESISKVLAGMKAPLGVYAVMGNHDYKPYDVVRPILKNAGVNVLENASVTIIHNGAKLRICGLKDWWHYKSDVPVVIGKVDCPTIFLSHNPDVFPQVPKDVSLTLSGHTHGGEVVLPILGAPFVPSAYGGKYSKGYVVENNKHLFVTSGVGTLSRHRLLNPPEIVLLNLYSQKGKAKDTIRSLSLGDLINSTVRRGKY